MKIDVNGRVKNMSLSSSRPLLPLYEGIINSVQAIEDANMAQGTIRIEVIRETDHLLKDTTPELGDIVGFAVTDNGIGFDDANYAAFETADTTYKANRGGKGIGRFLWLVAFEKVTVISVFRQDGQWKRRSFEFPQEGEGVSNMRLSDAKEQKQVDSNSKEHSTPLKNPQALLVEFPS